MKTIGDELILDVGCGDGKVTAEIARTVPRGFVTGTDVSAEMIAFARRIFPPTIHPNLRFEVCDAHHLSRKLFSPPETVDLVFSNAVLHWVDDHEQFLRAAATVLHPGGRLGKKLLRVSGWDELLPDVDAPKRKTSKKKN